MYVISWQAQRSLLSIKRETAGEALRDAKLQLSGGREVTVSDFATGEEISLDDLRECADAEAQASHARHRSATKRHPRDQAGGEPQASP
jgi:hypothetical protein